ncbi:MAG TPA: hypothetical protein PLD10_02045, partial [Rhodopila sp.]|nr:hypothetical protein [Rhodopila sp.]
LHTLIQDDATGAPQIRILQQGRAAAVYVDAKPFKLKRELKRVANSLVIVGDQHEIASLGHQ